MIIHRLRWFKNRIGKRVYRLTKTNCCPTCDRVEKEGLIIGDKTHANYLFDCQNSMNLEYSDKLIK